VTNLMPFCRCGLGPWEGEDTEAFWRRHGQVHPKPRPARLGSRARPLRVPPAKGRHLWVAVAPHPLGDLYLAEVAWGIWVRADRLPTRLELAELARSYRRGEILEPRRVGELNLPGMALVRPLAA